MRDIDFEGASVGAREGATDADESFDAVGPHGAMSGSK
jgi:hypothetical protein